MVYTNLMKECHRKEISRQQLANLWGISYNTACEKLNGNSRIYLDEALKVNRIFFPEFTIDYLFEPLLDWQVEESE